MKIFFVNDLCTRLRYHTTLTNRQNKTVGYIFNLVSAASLKYLQVDLYVNGLKKESAEGRKEKYFAV